MVNFIYGHQLNDCVCWLLLVELVNWLKWKEPNNKSPKLLVEFAKPYFLC